MVYLHGQTFIKPGGNQKIARIFNRAASSAWAYSWAMTLRLRSLLANHNDWRAETGHASRRTMGDIKTQQSVFSHTPTKEKRWMLPNSTADIFLGQSDQLLLDNPSLASRPSTPKRSMGPVEIQSKKMQNSTRQIKDESSIDPPNKAHAGEPPARGFALTTCARHERVWHLAYCICGARQSRAPSAFAQWLAGSPLSAPHHPHVLARPRAGRHRFRDQGIDKAARGR